MSTLGWLRQSVIDWIEDESDLGMIDRAINRAVDVIQKENPFNEMNREVTVTPNSEGIVDVPARCVEVIDIAPAVTNGSIGTNVVFQPQRRIQTDLRMTGYFYASAGIVEVADVSTKIDAVNGSNVFTNSGSTLFTQENVGKEIALKDCLETYRIVSVDATGYLATVYPEYKYADKAAMECWVNPVGTQRLKLYDHTGALYTGDVTIYYRRKHPILVNSEDRLMFPAENYVSLSAVMFMLRQTKYDVDAQRLQYELEKYKKIECKQNVKSDPNLNLPNPMFRIHRR